MTKALDAPLYVAGWREVFEHRGYDAGVVLLGDAAERPVDLAPRKTAA